MKHMTRDINPVEAQDLLQRVPRASLAFANNDQGPCAQPIAFVWLDGRYFVGLSTATTPHPIVDQEVVLLIDEGLQFFDLRAIYIRGNVKRTDAPAGAPADQLWFEVIPTKTVAWDYGTLHEVQNDG